MANRPAIQQSLSMRRKITKEVSCRYLLYLPPGYSSSAKPFPLLLFLHGAGERGTDLERVKVHGPPKLVEAGQDFQFVIASPQCPESETWSSDALAALIDEVVGSYRIDEDRLYVTGLSMGGHGTWALALDYPDRFAAIAPICGAGDSLRAGRIANLPVWVFHGERDETVSIERAENMVRAIEEAGGKPRFTRVPEGGHDVWTDAYGNSALYEWFLSHHRA